MRLPLIDKQGNFGSIAGLPPAQPYLIEAGLTEAAQLVFRDAQSLSEADFDLTADAKHFEPQVLPVPFPNLLVNGHVQLAGTIFPPHNMSDVLRSCRKLLRHPSSSNEELARVICGPDFPTGGVICKPGQLATIYETGRGTLTARGRVEIEDKVIVVKEIPFLNHRDTIVRQLAKVAIDSRGQIVSVEDHSGLREEVSIKIWVARNIKPKEVVGQLFEHTDLEVDYDVHLQAIVGGRPQTLSLKQVLQRFLDFRLSVLCRTAEFEKFELDDRLQLLDALFMVLSRVGSVVELHALLSSGEVEDRLSEIRLTKTRMKAALGQARFDQFIERTGDLEEFVLNEHQIVALKKLPLNALMQLNRQVLINQRKRLLRRQRQLVKLREDQKNVQLEFADDQESIIQCDHAPVRRTTIANRSRVDSEI